MKPLPLEILHDLRKIAEAQKKLNATLDKICDDIITYHQQEGNYAGEAFKREIPGYGSDHDNGLRGVPDR